MGQEGEEKIRVGGVVVKRIGGQIYILSSERSNGSSVSVSVSVSVVGCVHTWRECGIFKHYCESVSCFL